MSTITVFQLTSQTTSINIKSHFISIFIHSWFFISVFCLLVLDFSDPVFIIEKSLSVSEKNYYPTNSQIRIIKKKLSREDKFITGKIILFEFQILFTYITFPPRVMMHLLNKKLTMQKHTLKVPKWSVQSKHAQNCYEEVCCASMHFSLMYI